MEASEVAELEAYRRWLPRIRAVCSQAALGNLEPRLLNIDVDGELGETLLSINLLLDRTDAFVREAAAALEFASNDKYFRKVLTSGLLGSFRRGAEVINQATDTMSAKNDALLRVRERQLELADAFESKVRSVVQGVAGSAIELQRTAQVLSTAAEETTRQADLGASSVDTANTGLSSITRSIEDLSTAVGDISRQVTGSVEITQEAVREAEAATAGAQELSSSSDQIGSVIHLIREVAEQTNLLALNATIEAARAGDAGRGFAVVASEVKNLSSTTGDATQEVEQHVGAIRTGSQSTAGSIASVAHVLTRLTEISSTIAAAVEEQDAVTSEVSRSTHSAAESARQVLETIGGVRAAAQETTQSSNQLLRAAGDLTQASQSLEEEVEAFLGELRD